MYEQAAIIDVPTMPASESLHRKFERLAEVWREETGFLSSSTEIAMHPAYQQIIGMGPSVVPLLLAELRREPNHWFWALKSITGADPVPVEHRGRLEEMTQDWMRWGAANGYIR